MEESCHYRMEDGRTVQQFSSVQDQPVSSGSSGSEAWLRVHVKWITVVLIGVLILGVSAWLLTVFLCSQHAQTVHILVCVFLFPLSAQATSLCQSPACLSASVRLQSFMNSSGTCRDSFQVSCGWEAREGRGKRRERGRETFELQSLPPASRWQVTWEHNLRLLRALLAPLSSAEEKAKRFYRACMDQNRVIELGAKPIQEVIDKLGGWSLAGVWKPTDFNKTLQTIMRDYNTFPFFSVYIDPDPLNSSENRIQIDQPEFQISTQLNSNDLKAKVEALRLYLHYTVSLLLLLGIEANSTSIPTAPLIIFASQLSSAAAGLEDRQQQGRLYQRMSIAELQAAAPAIDWLGCLQATFHPMQLSESEPVLVHNLAYLISMSRYINMFTPGGDVNSYMILSVLHTLSPSLDPRFTEAKRNLSQQLGEKTEVMTPRWRKCVTETNMAFESVLDAMFVRKAFSKEKRDMAAEMISDLKSTLQTKLVNMEWLDEEARSTALTKISSLAIKLGHPASTLDQTGQDQLYSEFNVSEELYFHNTLQYLKFANKQMVSRLKREARKDDWLVSPLSVNVDHTIRFHDLVFPAGLFQEPFFHVDYPRAVNFGVIGTVIANEFLQTLYKTIGVSQRFLLKIAECSQLRELNYAQTLQEDWTKNGALHISLQAYKSWLSRKHFDSKLPSLANLSNTDLFYISYTQVICGLVRDPHGQVNRGVANPSEYSQGFNCPPASPTNPSERCSLWA
ncbi:endothelin-converting enzyme 1-like isoform X3 [Acipenser ruthenus]|uniref:endothelin-converting enzyme 1-like isoform X3 n=1 Tax=Acipenser ruthenus TaxID=7906 RepID=UPI002740FFA0|nr:endothelin-converting enzyme 1-like isoform X3 [Acipenser ruthenus]